MSEKASPRADRVRAAEVIAALSLATDLGIGVPLEHGLHSTLFAVRLGERLGVDAETASQTYYACLLFYIGCTAGAETAARIFGGDDALTTYATPVRFGSRLKMAGGFMRAVAPPGSPSPVRAVQIARGLPRAARTLKNQVAAQCEVGQMLSDRLGLLASVQALFAHLAERWDGKGEPGRASHDEIPLPVRIVHVARDAAFQRMLGGEEFAARVVRERAGRAFDPDIVQLHAGNYRNPSQLQDGGVLVVGVGNSGGEIAVEVASRDATWLAGKESDHVPFRIEGVASRFIFHPLLFRFIGHRVLTVDTSIGRKMRPKLLSHGAPLVRVKPKDIAATGIQRVPRVMGVRDGLPLLEDQRVLDVANVIWCTRFRPNFSWIDLPVFDEEAHEPMHHLGVVASEPGLYFVGLFFLYAMSSGFFPGVGRDAEHIATHIVGGGSNSGRGVSVPSGVPERIGHR